LDLLASTLTIIVEAPVHLVSLDVAVLNLWSLICSKFPTIYEIKKAYLYVYKIP